MPTLSLQVRLPALLTLFLSFFFAQVCARAASYAPENLVVHLDSLATADEYAQELVKEIDKALPTDPVLRKKAILDFNIDHVGPVGPAELEAVIRWVEYWCKRNNVRYHIHYRKTDQETLNKIIDGQQAIISENWDQFAKVFEYTPERKLGIGTSSLMDWAKKKVKNFGAHLRHFFGVPGGVTILSYYWNYSRDKRTQKQKIADGAFAVGKGLVTSVVTYASLQKKRAAGQDVNIALPIGVSLAWNFFFDYFLVGNSACKGQGSDFRFDHGKIEMNIPLFQAIAFAHSILVRQSVMFAAMGPADFSKNQMSALWTSIRGLLSRAPVEISLESWKKKNKSKLIGDEAGDLTPEQKVINMKKLAQFERVWSVASQLSSTFFASLQIADLFSLGSGIRTFTAVMGTIGLGVILYQHRDHFINKIKRFIWTLNGRGENNPEQTCKTVLRVTGRNIEVGV